MLLSLFNATFSAKCVDPVLHFICPARIPRLAPRQNEERNGGITALNTRYSHIRGIEELKSRQEQESRLSRSSIIKIRQKRLNVVQDRRHPIVHSQLGLLGNRLSIWETLHSILHGKREIMDHRESSCVRVRRR